MRLWPRKDTSLVERVEAAEERVAVAEREAREYKEAVGELTRVIANSPMLGAPGAELPQARPLYAYDTPITYSTPQSPRRHPMSAVTVDTLRTLADTYDILRSCIQHLKREVDAVPIQFVARDAKAKPETVAPRVKEAEEFFGMSGGCGGIGRRRSHFEGELIEDALVVGAGAIHFTPTRGGSLYEAVAIDAATIRPRVDAFGWPGPSDKVYEQWIYGVPVASFTRDELLYDGLNPVSYSPYFKSPVEWLVNCVYTALKADEWNRLWLTEGNTPSDLLAAPEDWKPDQIKEFAAWFDSLLAGNTRERIKTKVVPSGTSKLMSPTRKDQDFSVFELWLLRRTCSIMGVQPASIGYVGEQYKASQEDSMASTTQFGAGALLAWRKAIYDEILCRLGFADLECRNVTSQEEGAKERADRITTLTGGPVWTINEGRAEDGKDPIEGGDVLLVPTSSVPLEHALNPPEENAENPGAGAGASTGGKEERTALVQWERKAISRLKSGRGARVPFESADIRPEVHRSIRESLETVTSPQEVREVFRAASVRVSLLGGGSWERKGSGRMWRSRRPEREVELCG